MKKMNRDAHKMKVRKKKNSLFLIQLILINWDLKYELGFL